MYSPFDSFFSPPTIVVVSEERLQAAEREMKQRKLKDVDAKIEELKADVAEADRLYEKIFTMMARNCGKKDDYFKKKVFNKKHADWFMDAQEAKRHGLVNHLRLPKLSVKVGVEIDFE